MKSTFLIADAQPLMAEIVQQLLHEFFNFVDSSLCYSHDSLLQNLVYHKPSLIILDGSIGKPNSLAICEKIKKISVGSKILVFGEAENLSLIKNYFNKGISGYLLRSASRNELLKAVKSIESGINYLDDTVSQMLCANAIGSLYTQRTSCHLTKRELQVLQFIIEEYTTKEIAQELFIELCTVETHRQHLMQKLAVKNTAGLVRVALQRKLYVI